MKMYMIRDFSEVNLSDTKIEILYKFIYDNYNKIFKEYAHILNPKKNSLTKKYLDAGFEQIDAYSLSFMVTIILYNQLNNIKN